MLASGPKLVAATVVAALFGAACYVGSTAGVRALRSSEVSTTTAPGAVPDFIYRATETVPTTDGYGPVGPISVVFAGTDVRTGLAGEMDNPWIAVSSQSGDYRALSAPHRPEAGAEAVQVSADGRQLAWGFEEGLVVYDALEDQARELVGDLGSDPLVGPFSPDGRRLLVFDGSLRVLEVDSGEVVATLSGVDERAAGQAVWTADGSALSYVDAGRLVTHAWQADTRTATPAPISDDATLAWAPAGEQLASMQESRGVKTVQVFDVTPDGELTQAGTLRPEGYGQQRLLGFAGDTSVAVVAQRLQTGPLELVYELSTVDTSPPVQTMQMPGQGTNWTGSQTLQVAAQPLVEGTASFEEPSWPWSDVSKLVASVVVTAFLLGLYVTRPVRNTRRR